VAELRMPAPPRAVQRIDALAGSFKLIGPTKMLTFRFDDLKPNSKKPLDARQDGVKVRLTRIVREPDKWSFDIFIDNPPGGPTYESHQAHEWLRGNRIWLQKGDGKSTVVWKHSGAEDTLLDSQTDALHAGIQYHFPLRDGATPSRIGKLEDWSLVYETPGPIIETQINYSFTELPLP
jgi:hypothetical protein